MRFISAVLVFAVIYCVSCKNNVKSLTESMGQEVIEIGAPVKELPPELEEEPSAEVDDDEKPVSTAATVMPATKKDVKKATVETRRKLKDVDPEEDDARIEKELAEIYKDNAEYKDTTDEPTAKTNATVKPVLRTGGNFKFQPDMNNKKAIEKFRTSIDDISCAKSVTKLDNRDHIILGHKDTKKTSSNGGYRVTQAFLSSVSTLAIIYTVC